MFISFWLHHRSCVGPHTGVWTSVRSPPRKSSSVLLKVRRPHLTRRACAAARKEYPRSWFDHTTRLARSRVRLNRLLWVPLNIASYPEGTELDSLDPCITHSTASTQTRQRSCLRGSYSISATQPACSFPVKNGGGKISSCHERPNWRNEASGPCMLHMRSAGNRQSRPRYPRVFFQRSSTQQLAHHSGTLHVSQSLRRGICTRHIVWVGLRSKPRSAKALEYKDEALV